MAQAPTLPSITIPSAEYTTPQTWELKNTKMEGDGVRLTFLYENWPVDPPLTAGQVMHEIQNAAVTAVSTLFTVTGELSTATGQPVYKPWFETPFSGTPDSRHPTYKVTAAGWPGENDGSGGRKPLKGDVRFTLTPAQTFRTTITAEII